VTEQAEGKGGDGPVFGSGRAASTNEVLGTLGQVHMRKAPENTPRTKPALGRA